MSIIYNIKVCDASDINKVKHFIDEHWKKNHVLAISQPLLDFQHYEAYNNIYNFVIAFNNLTNEIDGLIGFIPTSHYDKALSCEKDYWGAIWKIRQDVVNEEIKTLGLDLFERFNEITCCNTFGAIGISAIAKKIYKALKFKVGQLNQFYILNERFIDFKIAEINNAEIRNEGYKSSPFNIRGINDLSIADELDCFYTPKKSVVYLINRYKNHPIYKYSFFGIYENNKLRTIFIARTVAVHGVKVIRIVDLLGEYNELPNLYNEIQSILNAENAEYIDCMNFGISEDVFFEMGFIKHDINSGNIIPVYFEPFEKKNIQIEFAYRSEKSYMIFKGDSDQDRPNII